MEADVGRYLGVFLPFIATLAIAHYIIRQSGSPLLAGTDLASPRLFRRAIGATGVAVTLIIAVDVATGGALFLRPKFPESQLLITLLLVGLFLAYTVGRSIAPLARWLKRFA
ncbi:MAG: hypothetical protein QOH08_1571 [Chloroflexota bacterium]|jgi:hypothetical protein|nr:hypothetical protein [Chloroflexota bacterium]